jgi:integrase
MDSTGPRVIVKPEPAYAHLRDARLPMPACRRNGFHSTGQGQGDLLKLPWSAWDRTPMPKAPHGKIRLRQGNTGVGVEITVSARLNDMLDATPRLSPVILLNSEGKPWTSHGFSSSWRKACKRAGITGITFNDLRGTFVTRAAINGATEAEIASATGHALDKSDQYSIGTTSTATRPSAKTS